MFASIKSTNNPNGPNNFMLEFSALGRLLLAIVLPAKYLCIGNSNRLLRMEFKFEPIKINIWSNVNTST